MEITINTKYGIGDTVIGYVANRGFVKYKITDIKVIKPSMYYTGETIVYSCEEAMDKEKRCADSFSEHELFTESDIRDRLNKFLTYPTTSEEAKHDIGMYKACKQAAGCSSIFNTGGEDPVECVKWLESKFPELDLFINVNKK